MPDSCAALIDELVRIRKAQGLTQKELAASANLAQPAIARLESKATTPRLDTILAIASALGYDLSFTTPLKPLT